MIVFNNVTKLFGAVSALSDISFSVKKGEIVGLLGPNGAGKTTTMRLIMGYLQPSLGSITVENLSPTSDRMAVNKLIGYLPENNPLWQDMLVHEYLYFVAAIKDVPQQNSVTSVIENCDLSSVLFRKIEQLSRGYKQRVGLAAALLGNPEVLVLDEPTSGLDPIEQDKMRKLIKSLQNKTTVIISTHILSEVESSCTRALIIYNGTLVYDGTVPKKKGGLDALFRRKVKII